MQSRQTIIEFQANLVLGKIIEAQVELDIPDEDMPPIIDHIQSVIHEARRSFLS